MAASALMHQAARIGISSIALCTLQGRVSHQLFSSASVASEQKVTDGTAHSPFGLMRQTRHDAGLTVILLVLPVSVALRP